MTFKADRLPRRFGDKALGEAVARERAHPLYSPGALFWGRVAGEVSRRIGYPRGLEARPKRALAGERE